MSSRSLNKVQLIGNLTRDPELRYTPQGTAVCTLGLATNRSWTTENGEKREETEFHRVVAWNKLAELCSQLLFKGRKVYVEGRLQTRTWTAQDGSQRQSTEVVIEEMIILDSRQAEGAVTAAGSEPVAAEPAAEVPPVPEEAVSPVPTEPTKKGTKTAKTAAKEESTDLQVGDIPF
ncbi:single-stranded DNA-binding protein [Candidatus Shapirobacteria bacterium CG03_land_8_20_14_0_80_39_12]|uniref:Single-stranded DNA-binding protein n=1 Tax=Candidatus Shapirobacteria bacterium CG03_land_8_20_14_0_80_39_12 TaxID=1974879 RepID=A0A2M7BCN4_9BACT|nr:MAG: single-stranded DNA-binding protein [Candidatus Shapirobacteria bacterium CG03_land_8_20_14_0_80_39_12]